MKNPVFVILSFLALSVLSISATEKSSDYLGTEKSYKIARAFRMLQSRKAAHETAKIKGFSKRATHRGDGIIEVYYTGPTSSVGGFLKDTFVGRVSLILTFAERNNKLTVVTVRVGSYSARNLNTAFKHFKIILGVPKEVFGGSNDDVPYDGSDRITYASWPYFDLSRTLNDIWLERSWAK